MPPSRRRLGKQLAAVVLAVTLCGAAGAARGGDSIFDGVLEVLGFDPASAIAEVEVAQEIANQFTPHLKKILTAEIHFLRKLCRPDAEQLAEIREAGLAEANSLARELARLQQNNRGSKWPDPREKLSAALLKKVDAIMPEAAAQRYAAELAAREAARKQAAAGMMTVLIDRQLLLTPEQFDKVETAIGGDMNEEWTRNPQMFVQYSEYAPMPPDAVLNPLLSERQRAVWSLREQRGTIHFGWEFELGMDGRLGAALEELDEYPAEDAE